MTTQSLTCAETAKLIRQALKEAFPSLVFSVKSKTYSGGASITIYWTDGASVEQVKSIAGIFEGSYFDGMEDYKGQKYAMIDGISTRFGADFVFYNRDFSDVAVQSAIDKYHGLYREKFEARGISKPTAAQFNNGDLLHMQIDAGYPYDATIQRDIRRILGDYSTFHGTPVSKTKNRVIYLGNDGYSPIGALREGIAA